MTHQIKINRAHKLAPKSPMAIREIWDSIPDELVESMTSKQLAIVVNALDHHWHKAVKQTEEDIVSAGYVWSHKDNKPMDIINV